jgi:conjugative transfer region protein (TIGR03750 family)
MSPQAPLADRVNVEPPIINGMSQTEIAVTGSVSFAVFFALGSALALATGVWAVLMIFAIAGPLLSVVLLSKHLATIKRNRPDGYYVHWLRLRLVRVGFKAQFVAHDGHWQIGRGLD